jgi:hypothetical protein
MVKDEIEMMGEGIEVVSIQKLKVPSICPLQKDS